MLAISRCLKVCCLILGLLAGVATAAPERDAPPKPLRPLAQVIADLRSDDAKTREQAIDALSDLGERGPTHEESLTALKAAFDKLPAAKSGVDDPAGRLIDFASATPADEGVAIIRKGIATLGVPGRTAALRYLVCLKSPQSIGLFAELYPKDAENLDWLGGDPFLDALPNDTLQRVLISSLSGNKSAGMAAPILLEAAEKGKLPEGFLASQIKEIGAASDAWVRKIAPQPRQMPPTIAERWAESYRDLLTTAEYFPDLLGHAGPGATPHLRAWLTAKDPRLSCFAAVSLLKLKQDVPQEEIALVAADDEMRCQLYDQLAKIGQQKRFPEKFRTQESFARSEMVRWLVYPTELNRAPDDIELMKVVEVKEGPEGGPVGVYVFRFRTLGDHWAAKKGWMAGVAGGYKKADMPTTSTQGDTFSTFEPYEGKTPEQHVERITGLISEAWKKQAEKKGKE